MSRQPKFTSGRNGLVKSDRSSKHVGRTHTKSAPVVKRQATAEELEALRKPRPSAAANQLRWYVTPVARDSTCGECGRAIAKDVPAAFRFVDKMVVCAGCQRKLGLNATKSKRYKAA